MRRRYSPLPLGLLLVVGQSCSSGADAPGMRKNVYAMLEGTWSQTGCIDFDAAECSMFQSSTVLSVAAQAKSIYVLTSTNGNWALGLSVSRDEGVTWTQVPLQTPGPNWVGLGTISISTAGEMALVLHFNEEGAQGTWRRCRSYWLDPRTGAYTPTGNIVGCEPPAAGGTITTWSYEVDPRSAGLLAGNFMYAKENLFTGPQESQVYACERSECQTHGAPVWGGTSHHFQPDKVCKLVVVPTLSPAVRLAGCSTAPELQTGTTPTEVLFNGQLGFSVAKDGHVFLGTIPDGTSQSLQLLELGEGDRLGRGSDRLPRVYGPGVDEQHVLKMRQTKVHRVGLPATPCVSDSACQHRSILGAESQVLWVTDAGDDEYWVIYRHRAIDDADGTTMNWDGRMRETLYFSREKDSNVPAATAQTPSTPLEAMCAREAGCSPYGGCLERWLKMHGATTEQDLAYQAFLATPPGCESFASTDPYSVNSTTPCTKGCHGGSAWSCYEGIPMAELPPGIPVNCLTQGTTCEPNPTADGFYVCTPPQTCAGVAPEMTGRCEGDSLITCPFGRIDCAALGMVCRSGVSGASCVLADRTCSAPFCDGTVSYSCTAEGRAEPNEDCGRVGLACEAGFCALKTSEPSCSGQARCEGTKLIYCTGFNAAGGAIERQRVVDCASMGLRCVAGTLPPGCVQ